MADKKYSKADAEARIEEFLDMVLDDADFDLTYDISGGEGDRKSTRLNSSH